MTEPTEATATSAKPTRTGNPKDHISTVAFMVVMVVTYAWFFSQALPYTT